MQLFVRRRLAKLLSRDALDCLIPFVAAYLDRHVGKQVDVVGARAFLRESFGFEIPLYAIEQLFPTLSQQGYVDYNPSIRRYIAKKQADSFVIAKTGIEAEFDEVTEALIGYASKLGFKQAPPSGTWGDALLKFLRNDTSKTTSPISKMHGVLLDLGTVELAIIGSFLKALNDSHQILFKSVLNIYMGVLIEEFISSVSEIVNFDHRHKLIILYDTSVLMRLLGTSGSLLRIATEELTRYLQDLGCEIYYFSGNESEVANIFNAIIFAKDSGKEIEGETAEAISAGEVSITDVRLLQNSFPETLANKAVFTAESIEVDAQKNALHQIDEKGFSEYLLRKANESKRVYSMQNRINDSGFLGNVMRLRKGVKTRDLSHCRLLFVTSNKFLASTSRRYLIDQKILTPQQCPPILSVGQIATIAWLLKDQILAPEKAGRELLSNCFAAVRPDAEWFRFFREGIEKVVGSMEEYVANGQNSITVQAARRIAQEESFGKSALVRELNMSEILQRAKEEEEHLLAAKELETRTAIERAALERKGILTDAEHQRVATRILAEKEKDKAIELAALAARETLISEIQETNRRRSAVSANLIIFRLKIISIIFFVLTSALVWWKQGETSIPIYLWSITALLAILSILAFSDLIGIPIVRKFFEALEANLADAIFRFLHPSSHS